MTDVPQTDPARIAEIQAREQAATKGPWVSGRLIYDQAGDYVVWTHRGDGEVHLGGPQRSYVGNVGACIEPVMPADCDQVFEAEKADAEFIAHAREDIPYLLAELTRLQAERDHWEKNAVYWHDTCEQAWRERDYAGVLLKEAEAARDEAQRSAFTAGWEAYQNSQTEDGPCSDLETELNLFMQRKLAAGTETP